MTISLLSKALLVVIASTLSASASCPKSLGLLVLRAAWVTPEYVDCELERVEPLGGGQFNALIKVTANSRITMLSNSEIWVRANIQFDTTPINLMGLSWRDFKAMVPPSSAYKMIDEIQAN